MVGRSKGKYAGRTRNIARHHKPSMLSVSSQIKEFNIGDKVSIIPKGNVKNAPHPRYKGKIGTIINKRGDSYIVELRIMSTKRRIIVPPLHLEGYSSKTV